MPRISREAVAGREALARRLFQGGATQEAVQKAMQEYDVGGGRKGLKMAPARLAEIEMEVKSGAVGTAIKGKDNEPEREEEEYASTEEVVKSSEETEPNAGLAASSPAYASDVRDGSVPVTRCVPGTSYRTSTKDGSRIELTGVYAGLEKGLACFNMDDGRVFKLWQDERVYLDNNAEANEEAA